MPVQSDRAITMPLKGSLPSPESLKMLIPIPVKTLPMIMMTARLRSSFLK